MTSGRMHPNELPITASLVSRLLGDQFPHWAGLPLQPVPSAGTDNALFRLGDRLLVRLPRIHWAAGDVAKEFRWLPRLAPHLPLTIPEPIAQGTPGAGYPWAWGVYRWLPGTSAATAPPDDLGATARALARFILALQAVDPDGGPSAADHNLRGAPLQTRDTATRRALAQLTDELDVGAALRVWEAGLRAPPWNQAAVWFHGDLLPGNLLLYEGRLSAVIDFAGMGVGDPACDLLPAWNLFDRQSRTTFRSTLGVDDATWRRGKALALSQAVVFIPYYRDSNPTGVARARSAVAATLENPGV